MPDTHTLKYIRAYICVKAVSSCSVVLMFQVSLTRRYAPFLLMILFQVNSSLALAKM